MLLIGAGLALHSLAKLTAVDPGFDADGQLDLLGRASPSPISRLRFDDRRRRSNRRTGRRDSRRSRGRLDDAPAAQRTEHGERLPGRWLRAEGAGRSADRRDARRVAEILRRARRASQVRPRLHAMPIAAAPSRWRSSTRRSRGATGRARIRSAAACSEYGGSSSRTVIGVIADVKHSGPAEDARPEVSLPYSQLDPGFMTTWSRGIYFVVRTASAGVAVGSAVRTAVAGDRPRDVRERNAVDGGARLRCRLGAALPHGAARHVRRARDRAGEHRRVRRALLFRHPAHARDRHSRRARRDLVRHPPHGGRPRSRRSRRSAWASACSPRFR